jgi:hypothetical protein
MKFYRLAFLLLPLALTACGLSEQQKADYATVEHSGVSSATYDKMLHGDPLSLSDIKILAHARVNDGIVLRYLRDHSTVYYLTSADVTGLKNAGVSPSIIDYMLMTSRQYGNGPYGYGPYGYQPWGPYGFGYGDPFWYGGGPVIFFGGGGHYHHH